MTSVKRMPLRLNTKSSIFAEFSPYEFTDRNDWLGLVKNDPEPFEFLGTDEDALIVSEISTGTGIAYNEDEPQNFLP